MDKKEDIEKKPLKHKRFRWLKITLGIIAGIWAAFLIVMHIMVNPAFLMRMADKYIPQYVDADVHIGNISASVLKSFPNLNIEVNDFIVTYPHDRYSRYDSVGVDGTLRHAGRSETVDTLAAVRKMTLSVNYLSALVGRVRIHEASLDKPHFFAHSYGDGNANWNVLKTSATEDNGDTTALSLPTITVNKICLTGAPKIVYTDCRDTVYAAIFLKQMHFHGKLTNASASANKLGLEIDTMFVSGRLPADTVALAMDHLRIHEKDEMIAFDAGAKAFLGMSDYGRVMLPLGLKGHASIAGGKVPDVTLHDFEADVAAISMTGNGRATFYADSTYIKSEISINECRVEDLIQYFGKNFFPEATDLDTDAKITLTALCDGYYNPARESLPQLIAELVMPKANVKYPGIPDGSMSLDINAMTDNAGRLDVSIDNMSMSFGGLDLDVTGTVSDAAGDDPLVNVEGIAYASLDEMMAFLPDTCGYSVSGELDAILTGKIRMSQMNPYNFYKAKLDGYVRSRNVVFKSQADTLDTWIGGPEIGIKTIRNKIDGNIPKGTEILALTAKVDSLFATYGKDIKVSVSGVNAEAQNAAQINSGELKGEKHPLMAMLSVGKLLFNGSDSLFAGVIGSQNIFNFSHAVRGKTLEPRLSISSTNSRVFAREGVNRYGFRDANFNASARMTAFERNQERNMLLDSLQRVYPGTPRDSLFRKMIRAKMAGRPVPDFIAEKDFRKKDLDLKLNETLAKYLKEWDMRGGLDIHSGMVITPYFPVRNVIENVQGTFNTDVVKLENFTLRPGNSDLSARGVLSGVRRALLGYGPLKLDLKLTSQKIDANELLTAYSAGAKYAPQAMVNNSSMDDAEYLSALSASHEAAAQDGTYALVVVPANLIADISLEANEVDYSDLKITWLASDMTMKERCIQLTNTLATSNMGDIFFEGFYSTKTKKDIKAGFDLNLTDITADKVVQLFPAVDTIMPMLTSFKGMLDCEMAATSSLDTNMNFITPSMSGIMKISGRNVVLEESPEFNKLARMLMFKNKKSGKVADMSVSGLISDNKLEIFPFVLKIDRYTLAMSGMQNFDQTFKYHVSVLKSPIPFRFGINIFGNFDNWKYRIGKAKYKSTNVPVFTAQIDTLQMNLVSSIHNIFTKGVDLAVRQNESMKNTIEASKKSMGYDPDIKLDSLDSGKMKMLDSLQLSYDTPVDSMLNARMDSLAVIPEVVETDEETGSKMQQYIDNRKQNRTTREERQAEKRRKREARNAARRGEALVNEETKE